MIGVGDIPMYKMTCDNCGKRLTDDEDNRILWFSVNSMFASAKKMNWLLEFDDDENDTYQFCCEDCRKTERRLINEKETGRG